MRRSRAALIVFLVLFVSVSPIRKCRPEKRQFKFHKIRSCYKSTLSVTSWKNFNNVKDCMKYALDKNGLAFNYSPPELKNLTKRWFRNCQVLGCAETKNSSTFVFDPVFDYYSAYGDLNSTINATCVKSVGLFDLITQKKNHMGAINFCQNLGADLADILTELRTNALASLLLQMPNFYKATYVGLSDLETEGTFETPLGNFLYCSKFRAWAPGHPRPGRKKEDCVILDADRTWKAINCKIKMGFICEFYPSPPPTPAIEFKFRNCTKIKNKRMKRKCLADQELYELYNGSSRIDQCALLNDFEE